MTSLFDFIQDLAKAHPPVDSTWSSSALRDFLERPYASAKFTLGSANCFFGKALHKELVRRTIKDAEVRRLYFAAIQSRVVEVVSWMKEDARLQGALAYHEIANLLHEKDWTKDQVIEFFDWLIFFDNMDETVSPMINYLLIWPDQHFVSLFSGDINPEDRSRWSDSSWMVAFTKNGQKERLHSILNQIPPINRGYLAANAFCHLIYHDASLFRDFVESASKACLDQGYLRDAFETYEFLRERYPSSYQDEMISTCRKILASDDGDTQLADAARALLPLEGTEALEQVLQWFNRPYVSGPGPWTMAPGGGRGSALYFATAHAGPDAFPLLEAALAKHDIELALDCLQCWTQFDYAETAPFVTARLGEIISNTEMNPKQRLEALETGVEWNVLLLEPLLLNCLQDKNRAMREYAARALARLGDKHWSIALEMLGSRKAPLRSTAIIMLEAMATRTRWDEMMRLSSLEENAGLISEWMMVLHTLSAGFGLPLKEVVGQSPQNLTPKPLLRRYKFKKVPPLTRADGSQVTEFELQYLFLCQWRSGSQSLAPEAATLLAGLDEVQKDALACHLLADLHCPPWMMPLIAHMCGPRTFEYSGVLYSQDFGWRRIGAALLSVKILNTSGSHEAQKSLASYRKCYPWFARLPWPGLDSGDLFQASF